MEVEYTMMKLTTQSTTPDNLNYHPVHQLHGKYRYNRLQLSNQTGNSVNLQSAGTSLLQWKFPAGSHFNPARDVLEYQLVVPKQAAGTAVWTYEDTVPEIDSFEFGTANGNNLAGVQYAGRYLSVARKIDTRLEEFLTSDYGSGLYPAEKLAGAANSGENYFPPATITSTHMTPYGSHASVVALSKRDPQYARTPGLNTDLVVTRSIPFSAFKGTALAMDRDMKFKDDMYLSISLAPFTRVAWASTSVSDPAAGAIPIAPAAAVKVQNLTLRHAEQIDPVIRAVIDEKFNLGEMIFNIPYVHGFRTPSTGNVANIQLTLPSQLGSKLKRVIHTAFSKDENAGTNLTYDHHNFNGAKIESFRTYLDNQPLQNEQMSCMMPTATSIGMDDWRENRKYLSESSIQDSATYYLNWFHVDNWSDPKKNLIPEENIVEGLDMIQPRTWGIEANTKADLIHYTWATFIRTVKTSPDVALEIYAAPTVVMIEQTRQ